MASSIRILALWLHLVLGFRVIVNGWVLGSDLGLR